MIVSRFKLFRLVTALGSFGSLFGQPSDNTGAESPYIEDGGVSVQPWYWLTSSRPRLRSGATSATTTPGNLDFPGDASGSYAITVGLPAGKQNSLRLSYLRTQGAGDTVAASDLALFSVGYTAGDALATRYKLQNVKVSWDFLSYTFQNNLRVKTLWEGQGTLIETEIDAPLKNTDSSSYYATGRKWLLLPTMGLGLGQAVSGGRFRWEAKASGFGIPKRAALFDAEAAGVLRLGRAELLGGYKVLALKTSPRDDAYFRQRLNGPFVGLRWYFDGMN